MNPTSLRAATVLSNDWGWIRGPRISEGVILTVQGDTSLSRVQLFPTEWSVAHQAPLSMGFSRQAYWSGMPFLSPGIFSTQGSNLRLPPALAGGFFPTSATWEA